MESVLVLMKWKMRLILLHIYLDLHLKNYYDAHEMLHSYMMASFSIFNFPFLCNKILAYHVYGAIASQLKRYGRTCFSLCELYTTKQAAYCNNIHACIEISKNYNYIISCICHLSNVMVLSTDVLITVHKRQRVHL